MSIRLVFTSTLIAILITLEAGAGFASELMDDIKTFSVSPKIDDFGDRFITNVDHMVKTHHDELLKMSHLVLGEKLGGLAPQEQAFLVGCWIRVRSDADEKLVEVLRKHGLDSSTYNLRMIDDVSHSEVRIRREENGRLVDCDLFRFECKNGLIVLCCIPNASSKSSKLPARLRVSWWIGANFVSKLTVVSYRIERGWESSPLSTDEKE